MKQPRHFFSKVLVLAGWLVLSTSWGPGVHTPLYGVEWTQAQLDFFESRIRPVLVDQCYACHNSTTQADGSLRLDHREGVQQGGEGGKILVPGKPEASRLMAILRHEVPGKEMPQDGTKLDEQVLEDFAQWIQMGAPDPRDQPPSAQEMAGSSSWKGLLEQRKQWWSFQPIRDVLPPSPVAPLWSEHPVDLFIAAALREQGLKPVETAEPSLLVRRLYFALIGIPPTIDEAREWTKRLSHAGGFEELVDHLLESPHFGERWARHWMDWLRYADSHGSEGDPPIENGWHYRDYLIRALNADVSFDQLVREHIAGDLLKTPRIDEQRGINESILGTSHWRMVYHGFSPTDALDEKVRFIDDQVNVFTKAFLGLTVSCARCHDHKFDPISQKDYYALFGIMSACRPGRAAIDLPDRLRVHRDSLVSLKPKIREALADRWLRELDRTRDILLASSATDREGEKENPFLRPWHQLKQDVENGIAFPDALGKLTAKWRQDVADRTALAEASVVKRWRFNQPQAESSWTQVGTGLEHSAGQQGGEFAIADSGPEALRAIFPAGVYSNLVSDKHGARLTSEDVSLSSESELWLQVMGGGGATARYVVYDYPRKGVVFPVTELKSDWQWTKFDMSYWNGDNIHVELTTSPDAPLLAKDTSRSWFGVRDILIAKKGQVSPKQSLEGLDPWFRWMDRAQPTTLEGAVDGWIEVLRHTISQWQEGTIDDPHALFLDGCMRHGMLDHRLDGDDDVKELVERYRQLESEIPVATRIPSLEETSGRIQTRYLRGNHKQPGEVVPHGFLEAIHDQAYQADIPSRLQLADDLLRSGNPLTRRVIVNRLWHHLFGRGIVATPDNFGRLGIAPTHLELLDFLARRFESEGGSMKKMIRFLITSQTWKLASNPSPESRQLDPENRYWSHAPVKRLEAEAIRDSLLAISGKLDRQLYGSPVDARSNRRSIYMRVVRNALDPFLRAFDFPEPFSAVGRREVTNVPAQSLALLNDPQVASLAKSWSESISRDHRGSLRDPIAMMFVAALGREADEAELAGCEAYWKEAAAQHEKIRSERETWLDRDKAARAALQQLMEPIRRRLTPTEDGPITTDSLPAPEPIARWEFDDDFADRIGSADAIPKGGAVLQDGALVVDGKGYAVAPLRGKTLRAKTLEAWVQLDTLEQKGGGVLSLMNQKGAIFDAIVYGEKNPRQWLAGSNRFERTQSFNGPEEAAAVERQVHVAIAYHEDGTIVAYRDGELYGTFYRTAGPQVFESEASQIGFGIRHLPAGGSKMLRGRIFRAQLYDRDLSADEVRRSAQLQGKTNTEAALVAGMSPMERESYTMLQKELATIQEKIKLLEVDPTLTSEQAAWFELARAIFTFQELIFVR